LPTLAWPFYSENRKLTKSQVVMLSVLGREQIIPQSYLAFIGKVDEEVGQNNHLWVGTTKILAAIYPDR